VPEPQPQAAEPAIHLQGLVALLGGFPALAGVDLRVDPGELVLLRGANGAGKTTLLRVCAGLVPVAQGRADVLGHDLVADRRVVGPQVALLGHGPGLYEDLTVAENVRFWARAAGARRDDADEAMARFGVDGRLAQVPAHRLSAGQRRRAALACLASRRPRLWLLDEPHAALDAAGRALVDQLVADATAAGQAVLIATHEPDGPEATPARVITVGGGVVVGDEPAAAKEPVRVP
jgi:heme ABC exporter ATP-binding subunit CcmA